MINLRMVESIIKDDTSYGNRGFSSSYGSCLILEAKLKAILDEILLARPIWVKTNSDPNPVNTDAIELPRY